MSAREFWPKQILVTGGAGFIGSAFVRLLCAKGCRVVVLDALTYAGLRESLIFDPAPGQMELVVGDIGNTELVSQVLKDHKIDAVVNFAAESHVDRSISRPQVFIETNVLGTAHLLTAALNYWQPLPEPDRRRFRYVQISTDEVYGSLGPTGTFSEASPYAPNSPYSASKAGGDHLVRAWHHTYGLPTITTNCSNNYGPRQFPEKLIPQMIHCALAGKRLPVYGDGANVRDWIHVEDHCAGVWLALTKGIPGSTYCFGGNAERSNLEVVRAICAHLDVLRPRVGGKKYEELIQFVEDRPGHDRRYAMDDSLAERELGFQRRYEFTEGLRATVDWYLARWAARDNR